MALIADYKPRRIDTEDYSFLAYYEEIAEQLKKMPQNQRDKFERKLCLRDRFYLLWNVCKKGFMGTPYVYYQCKFIDDLKFNKGGLDGWIFVWFREGFKSTIINSGEVLQSTLADPEATILVMSHSAPAAKDFVLEPVIGEIEKNDKLRRLFSSRVWHPGQKITRWSIDAGYIFPRDMRGNTPTIYAAGIDAPPTRMHFSIVVCDDVVAEQTVQTDERMQKTVNEYEHTLSLGRNVDTPGLEPSMRLYIDTLYDANDCTCHLINSGEYKVDIMPCFGPDGVTPLAHTVEGLNKLRRKMSPYIFSCQYLCDPLAQAKRKFTGVLHHYQQRHETWSHIGLCDPAGGFKKKRDHDPNNTAMGVIGRDELSNEYLVDAVYDQIDLRTRIAKMFELTRRYKIQTWYYEKSGMIADINELERWMNNTGLWFELIPVTPVDNKEYRIERDVIGRVENGIMKFPKSLYYTNVAGEQIDIIKDVLRAEMRAFPRGKKDDFLDMLGMVANAPIYGADTMPLPVTDAVHRPQNPAKAARNALDSTDHVPTYI